MNGIVFRPQYLEMVVECCLEPGLGRGMVNPGTVCGISSQLHHRHHPGPGFPPASPFRLGGPSHLQFISPSIDPGKFDQLDPPGIRRSIRSGRHDQNLIGNRQVY